LPLFAAIAMLALFVAAASLMRALPIRQKPNVAYESFVAGILAGADGARPVYLIGGDPDHEGGFIEDVALQEPAAKHIVLRATKALARTDWSTTYYEPLFKSTPEMAAFLNQSWISLVVLQEGAVRPDLQMLHATMLESRWTPLPAPSGTLAWRRTTPLPSGEIRVRIDMRESLGKVLEAAP
jgi:hypothetical protein